MDPKPPFLGHQDSVTLGDRESGPPRSCCPILSGEDLGNLNKNTTNDPAEYPIPPHPHHQHVAGTPHLEKHLNNHRAARLDSFEMMRTHSPLSPGLLDSDCTSPNAGTPRSSDSSITSCPSSSSPPPLEEIEDEDEVPKMGLLPLSQRCCCAARSSAPALKRQVTFACDPALTIVHYEGPGDYPEDLRQYRLDGRCWEQDGRDRCRFRDRVRSLDSIISPSFVTKSVVRDQLAASKLQSVVRGWLCRRKLGSLSAINRSSYRERLCSTTTSEDEEGVSFSCWKSGVSSYVRTVVLDEAKQEKKKLRKKQQNRNKSRDEKKEDF